MSAAAPVRPAGDPAWVVFSGETEILWLRLLRPGFRHCFAVVRTGGAWIVLDPLSHATTLAVVDAPDHWDPAEWFTARGLAVAATAVHEPAHRAAPWRPYTCVEAVKRLLGRRMAGVFTPWQLYRALLAERPSVRDEEKNLDKADEVPA